MCYTELAIQCHTLTLLYAWTDLGHADLGQTDKGCHWASLCICALFVARWPGQCCRMGHKVTGHRDNDVGQGTADCWVVQHW